MYGETDVMRRRVERLREQADDIRAEADQLVGRFENVPWTGRAADAMGTRIKQRAVALRTVAERHDVAADTLERHVGEVDRLKEAIAAAEKRAADRPEDPGVLGSTHPPRGHKDWLELKI